jgi:hypothetical protein
VAWGDGQAVLELASAANDPFGLAAYTLHLPNGIDVWSPRPQTSHAVNPRTVTAPVGSGVVLSCPWDGLDQSPRVDSSHTEDNSSARPYDSEFSSTDPTTSRAVPSPFDRLSGAQCVADTAHLSEPAQRRAVPRRRSPKPAPTEHGALDQPTVASLRTVCGTE